MLSVTLSQWCNNRRLDRPSPCSDRPPTRVFALHDTDDSDSAACYSSDQDISESTATAPDAIVIGSTNFDDATVDKTITHMVWYVNRGGSSSTYPKCAACGLPGHKIDQCHPLINHCLVQALAYQHPELIKRIKAAYTQFPRNARKKTPRKATVKQVVAILEIPSVEDMPPPTTPPDTVSKLDLVT
jgi:hypothetical protein